MRATDLESRKPCMECRGSECPFLPTVDHCATSHHQSEYVYISRNLAAVATISIGQASNCLKSAVSSREVGSHLRLRKRRRGGWTGKGKKATLVTSAGTHPTQEEGSAH